MDLCSDFYLSCFVFVTYVYLYIRINELLLINGPLMPEKINNNNTNEIFELFNKLIHLVPY